MKNETRELLGKWAAVIALLIGIGFFIFAIKLSFFN